MNKLSIIMPCYNSENFIKDAIKSILTQTFQDFQFIIIDDGSVDKTEDIILSFRDPRILYKKKEHSGLTDSLNYGLKLADAELIARMDADDICVPIRLARQYSFLKNNVYEKKVVSSWSALFRGKHIEYIINENLNPELIKKKLLLHSFLCHPAVMFNKDIIINNGGYRGDAYEDYELWLRIHKKVSFHILPEVLIFQRIREDSKTRKDFMEKLKIHYDIQEHYYEYMIHDFGIKSEHEENEYRGWREYFYGKAPLARHFWKKLGIRIIHHPRILIAFFISFFPTQTILLIKNFSPRYRLNYILHYFSKSSRKTRNNFKSLIKHD